MPTAPEEPSDNEVNDALRSLGIAPGGGGFLGSALSRAVHPDRVEPAPPPRLSDWTPEELEGFRKLDEHNQRNAERIRQDQIRLNQYQRDNLLPVTKFKPMRSIEQEEFRYRVKVTIGIIIAIAFFVWAFWPK